MERNLSAFASELGQAELAAAYERHAAARLASINALMWDAAGGQWRDLVLQGPAGVSGTSRSSSSGGSRLSSSSDPAAAAAGSAAAAAAEAPEAAEPDPCSSFSQSGVVAASNWVPLYCGCAAAGGQQAAAALAGLRASGLLQEAGVAVSLVETGEQRDAPNSWPPLTCMLLEGCERRCGREGAQVRC